MGRRLPEYTNHPTENAEPAPQGPPLRGPGAPSSSAVFTELSLATEVPLRSLSSLLLATRVEAGLRRPPSLGALSRPLARPPLPPPPPPLAPPAGTWRGLLSDMHQSSSPPPLAPPSDSSDSEADMGDLPALLSGSPSSQQPSLEDLLCPWGADSLPLQAALHLQPLVRRGSASTQAYVAYRSQRPAGSPAGRRVPQQTVAPPVPLEDELQALAGRLAELVGTHQAQLGATHSSITAGLKDVANQLHRFAAELQAGPPPPV